jgi:hypothetical protein
MLKHVALSYPIYNVVADSYYIHVWPNLCLFFGLVLRRLLQAVTLEMGRRVAFGRLKSNCAWMYNKYVVRSCSFSPISRPRDATCDRFLFAIYVYITLHVSSVKRSSSGVPHRIYSLQFLCLCLSAALFCKELSFLQDSAADRHKHRNWRLYVWWGTLDDERLTLETCRVIHI